MKGCTQTHTSQYPWNYSLKNALPKLLKYFNNMYPITCITSYLGYQKAMIGKICSAGSTDYISSEAE